MGVRGLATYVAQRADHYMEYITLRNCFIVIDGSSLAAQLYNHTPNTNCCFGGDYDNYASCILEFFNMLQACGIKPLVVFDGGYERAKVATVESRLKDRIHGALHQSPVVQKKHFPVLYKEVLKDVLIELGVHFAQCLFEADEEIAAIARHMNCPVLSYDSDFFIYNVDYIPFPTIEWRVHEDYPLHGPYLKCSKFKVDSFLDDKGLKKEILPFLAVTLGNDYISRSVFQHFVTNLKRIKSKKRSETERNITGLLEWLRYETLETAISKVSKTLPKERRKGVLQKMKDIIALYENCSSDLLPHLGVCQSSIVDIPPDRTLHQECAADSQQTGETSETEEEDAEMDVVRDEIEEGVEANDREVDGSGGNKRVYAPWHKRTAFRLPEWFLHRYRAGSLPPIFMDMVTLRMYFIPPQVETIDMECSHVASMQIIRVLFGILSTSGLVSGSLVCYLRGQRSFRKLNVQPCFEAGGYKFPKLELLHDLPIEVRKDILKEVLGVNECEELKCVPEEWLLFVMVIFYWVRSSQVGVTGSHVLSLIVCFLTLNVIDRKSKIHNQIEESRVVVSQNGAGISDRDQDPSGIRDVLNRLEDILEKLQTDELVLVREVLSPFRQIEVRLKSSPKAFSAPIVHTFAEFQSCLLHARYLNALLGLPFINCSPHHVFNGTYIYNVYNKLRKKPNPVAYFDKVFSSAPSFLHLLKSIFNFFAHYLPVLKVVGEGKKGRRRKRGKGSQWKDEYAEMDNLYEVLAFIEGK